MNVIELRQYTLHPGRRDELIELFEREFVESQEQAGMTILGKFRDLDDPDRFVWLRGFRDMPTRVNALTAFYDGPVWAAHGLQAAATMVDSDDVRLLHPLGPVTLPSTRPPFGTPPPDTLVTAALWSFPSRSDEAIAVLRNELVPLLAKTGPAPLAVLATEEAENDFPRLPIRTDDSVVAILTAHPDEQNHRRHLAVLQQDLPPTQILRLAPTGRSLIR